MGHYKMELNGDEGSARLPGMIAVPATELSARYDSLFKTIVSSGWAVTSDGNVEAPTGAFARVEIPFHDGERAEMRDAVCDHEDDCGKHFDELEAGWYLTQEDSNGLIWVYWTNEVWATDAYLRLAEEYEVWETTDEADV